MHERPAYIAQLADFACSATLDTLSAGARDRARWVLADCVPVIAAGMQQQEMRAFVDAQLANGAAGSAWVIGTGRRAHALDAALLNGTAGTWLELDEGNLFARGHPGIQVVPAAIAVAQQLGSSGTELLAAIAIGYEVSARVSRAADVRLAVHPHGTYGVIGAAVAVARLKRFNAAQMCELLNVAPSMGLATSRQTLLDGATVRNIYTGHSGFMGITATRLVECGFTGEVDGIGSVYGKVLSETFDREKAIAGLGREWLIAQNYFKLHPTGRYAHAAIDALEDLLAHVPGGQLAADQIERVEVRTYMLAAMLAEKRVTSSFGARFSIPFALATILHHRHTGLACYSEEAVANPAVQALALKVDVDEDKAHTARYPNETPCDVRIAMRDGTTHAGHCAIMKGEPSNPHQPGQLEAKFFELGTPVWGEKQTRTLFDSLMQVEDIEDFRAFSDKFSL